MASVVGERLTSISTVLAQRLFETALDLILITDRRGKFIGISPSSLTILGYRPEEMTGRIGTEFIYPDDLDRTRNEMSEARRGRLTRNFGSRYVHKKGNVVTLAWNGVWSKDEQLHFFIGRDVTEAKLVERLKNEFVATVSHELRTPLTSIAGALGLLVANADATLPAPAVRLLAIAQANSQRLLRLVSGILDMDKIDSGRVVFILKQLNMRTLVEQAIESNRESAEGVGVRIRLDAASDAGELRGDPDWLIKVVTNLLSNAIKFSPPGGEVVVGIEKRRRNIRVSVRDYGPGVPDEFKGRMFEKFAQADTSDARTKGGTGLGLSIVKEIVTRLGGEIGFADAPGGGAIFHVELPAWEKKFETAERFADKSETAAPGDATTISGIVR
jgi:PAS domain S-box-containing protein